MKLRLKDVLWLSLGYTDSNLKSWDSNSVLSESEALLSLLCLRVKTLPYHSANHPGRGNLRTNCLHSPLITFVTYFLILGLGFLIWKTGRSSQLFQDFSYFEYQDAGDPSFHRTMAYEVCKCQQCPEPFSIQLFGKRRARGGHPEPASGKSTKAWRWDALGVHSAKPGKWTVCARPSEQGWAHGSVSSSLLHLLEAAPKVAESVGVFLLCFWKPEVSASVTLTDDICSLFGNTLFKSNLRWD